MPSSHRIRVAFCLDSFALGGTELNALRTAEALDPGRIELRVFHLQARGPLRPRYERLGVTMTHIPIPNLYSLKTARQGARFARQLRQDKIDVVHSHDIYCNIFAVPWARSLSRCRVVASRRWGLVAADPRLATINRLSCKLAHRIVANSSAITQLLVREEGLSRQKIVEVPNFLSESAFETASDRERIAQRRAWGLPDGAFAIGIVASLSPIKNHTLLLHAMTRLDEHFHLIVIGDGPSRAKLIAQAQSLGVGSRVHFTGEIVSAHNLHQYFDVSVLCSLSEGFPNSLIEAMAAGRPVVATPVGGIVDAITDDITGILVPTDDPTPTVTALRTLEADESLRARLGQAAIDLARRRFRQDTVIQQLMQFYETLADR
jgi:glycosyltransferase involved in cell wall biosynthesis